MKLAGSRGRTDVRLLVCRKPVPHTNSAEMTRLVIAMLFAYVAAWGVSFGTFAARYHGFTSQESAAKAIQAVGGDPKDVTLYQLEQAPIFSVHAFVLGKQDAACSDGSVTIVISYQSVLARLIEVVVGFNLGTIDARNHGFTSRESAAKAIQAVGGDPKDATLYQLEQAPIFSVHAFVFGKQDAAYSIGSVTIVVSYQSILARLIEVVFGLIVFLLVLCYPA